MMNFDPEAVQGSIPDMTATTAMYLELQRLYRDRADRDTAAVQVKFFLLTVFQIIY